MSLTETLRWHARHRPAKAAIREAGKTIDYATLDRTINGLCHELVGRGIARGQLVGVGLDDDAEHLITILALARIGAVLLPVDRRWNQAEKRSVIDRFKADHAIMSRHEDGHAEGWLVPQPDWFSGSDEPYIDEQVTEKSPLLLSLSSGTTGLPKGPRLTHEQLMSRFMVYWIDMGMNSSDLFVVATPLYFGGGRAFAIGMLWAGGTIDMFPPPYKPEELVAHVAEVGGTAMFLVPTLLRRLMTIEQDGLLFPNLRVLISSGSVLFGHEQAQVREKLTPNLFQYYASTEAGGVSILTPGNYDGHEDSVGRPCFRVEVEVVDEEDKPVPRGTEGRLRYKSPASPDGYYLGESAEAFQGGYFYPGDLALIATDGYVYLRGRSKDIIIRGGVNIHPGDIEQVLQQVPGVVESAVVAMPSADHGEEVAAFVVVKGATTEAELIAACRQHLAPYKTPKKIVFVDALPRNGIGKVLKKQLQARLAEPAAATS
jgi:acyl-CoA synthetase (AMP-forming)/AMP-acid ligase II